MTTSGKKLAGVQSRSLVSVSEEEARGAPTDQEEVVYQEVLGAALLVRIAQTEAAKPESQWKLPGELSQRLNRRQRKRVQAIPPTE